MEYGKNMNGSGWNNDCSNGWNNDCGDGCAQQGGRERRPEEQVSKLAKANVSNYEMDQDEQFIAQLIQAYLSGMTEEDALDLMQGLFKPTAVEIPPQGGTPDILKATVEGRQLAALIDHAVEDFRGAIEIDLFRTRKEKIKKMLGVVLDDLKKIDGTAAVQKLSFEFYRFLEDIYKALKY